MSECITKVEKILKVEAHPNADRLELATCRGWNCVVPKGVYTSGDMCVYIPIDSILPEQLEATLFEGSKVQLTKHRVKTIRLRGAISQGLIASSEIIYEYLGRHGKHVKLKEGLELTDLLGISKWEPPAPKFQSFQGGKQASKKQTNPFFSKYTSLENIKNYPQVFQPEDMVIATEKIHGTNFRAGWVPVYADTLWKKVKKFFRALPAYEFVYGSHNVQLQNHDKNAKVFYDNNIYYQATVKYNLKNILKKGEVLYGEIYGSGVQGGYDYGLKDEKNVVFFDLKIITKEDSKWADYDDLFLLCTAGRLPLAPVLFKGKFEDIDSEKLFQGHSILSSKQKTREGFVVGSIKEETSYMGRKKLKYINPEYLLRKGNTDYH